MKFLKYLFTLTIITTLVVSCDDEDFTGDSTLTATNPTLSFPDAPAAVTLSEGMSYSINVSISEAQVVDVPVYINVVGGDAGSGSDFTIDNSNGRALIAAGRTTATIDITILEDAVDEASETFTLQLGDERTSGVSISSYPTIEVTIADETEVSTALTVDLSWSADVVDASGNALSGFDVTDIDFYLQDGSGAAILASENGPSFESLTLDTGTVDNGTYELWAYFWTAIDLSELGDDLGGAYVDLTLDYNQDAVQSGSWSYPGGMHTAFADCQGYHFADVTATDGVYTITNVGKSTGDLEDYATSYGVEWIYNAGANVIPYNTSFTLVDENTIQEETFFAVFFGNTIQVNYDFDLATYSLSIPVQDVKVDIDGEDELDDVRIAGTGGIVDLCTGDFQITWTMDWLTTEDYGRGNELTRDISVPLSVWLGADNFVTVYTRD